MTEKLVSAPMCEQRLEIQFWTMEGRNGQKIPERLCNVYTKAISQLNVYEWIKKFSERCEELAMGISSICIDIFGYRKYPYENKNIDKYRDHTVKIK